MTRRLRIATIPGDGIGPEVINEGVKVVNAVGERLGLDIKWEYFPFGADYYLSTGKLLTEDDLKELEKFDAIYLGAVGDPRVKPGILERGIVLAIRFYFDQFINLRPIKLLPGIKSPLAGNKHIDFDIIRENTEDFYVGLGDIAINGVSERKGEIIKTIYSAKFNVYLETSSTKLAYDFGIISKENSLRLAQYAFSYARKNNKTSITFVDKANIVTHMYSVWREAIDEVARGYPEIKYGYEFADAIAMRLVREPEKYQLIVAPNLFGDILSDLGAALVGGLGIVPSANINPEGISMFEPVHGSAPDIKGKNIANPIATIWAGALMLRELGFRKAYDVILKAIIEVVKEGKVRTPDMGGSSKTFEVGNEIVRKLN